MASAGWTDPTVAVDLRPYGSPRVQVDGSPLGYVPWYSDNGITYYAGSAYDGAGNSVSSISTAGRYDLEGNCWVKLLSGSGATLITLSGYN